MPNQSKGQKRPEDVLNFGDDFPADDCKDKAAQSLGRRGGKALNSKRRD